MVKSYFIILILLGALSVLVDAQDGARVNLNFDHIALSVIDVDRSAAFYADVLELTEVTNRTAMEGIRWFSLGEGKELHLISILDDKVVTNKAVHFALSTITFDSILDKLKEEHIEYSDWPGNVNRVNMRADGVSQIFFQDPDGYWIEVNSVNQEK